MQEGKAGRGRNVLGHVDVAQVLEQAAARGEAAAPRAVGAAGSGQAWSCARRGRGRKQNARTADKGAPLSGKICVAFREGDISPARARPGERRIIAAVKQERHVRARSERPFAARRVSRVVCVFDGAPRRLRAGGASCRRRENPQLLGRKPRHFFFAAAVLALRRGRVPGRWTGPPPTRAASSFSASAL